MLRQEILFLLIFDLIEFKHNWVKTKFIMFWHKYGFIKYIKYYKFCFEMN